MATKKKDWKPSIQGLNDAQVLGMITVFSNQLAEYTAEWTRRIKERDADRERDDAAEGLDRPAPEGVHCASCDGHSCPDVG